MINWAHATLNFVWGCTKLTEECRNCYMFRLSYRYGRDPEKLTFFDIKKKIADLERWKEKNIIFVNSMSDTFHEAIPFETIKTWHEVFNQFPEKQFLVLTKRIGRAFIFYQNYPPPDNVWLGTSVGVRKTLPRIDVLKRIQARIRFVSFEPLLEDLGDFSLRGVHWAIVGGESDYSNPRPMKPEWAENIRRICERDGVAFWFKQMGGKGGDGAGGDILNGKKYNQYPRLQSVME